MHNYSVIGITDPALIDLVASVLLHRNSGSYADNPFLIQGQGKLRLNDPVVAWNFLHPTEGAQNAQEDSGISTGSVPQPSHQSGAGLEDHGVKTESEADHDHMTSADHVISATVTHGHVISESPEDGRIRSPIPIPPHCTPCSDDDADVPSCAGVSQTASVYHAAKRSVQEIKNHDRKFKMNFSLISGILCGIFTFHGNRKYSF